jgi:hypothetical protein
MLDSPIHTPVYTTTLSSDRHALPARAYLDVADEISPKDSTSCVGQLIQGLRARVPEAIPDSNADNGQHGTPGAQSIPGQSLVAAVVRNLQHRQRGLLSPFEHGRPHRTLRISGQ